LFADNHTNAHKANGNTEGSFTLPHVDTSDGGSSHGSSWTEDTVRKCCSKKTLYKRIPVLNLIENYHKGLIVADLVAGVTVGLTMVPQSIAYASVAGLPPQVISCHPNVRKCA
jgi:sodium-independent sulfate anion transporter 11